MKTMSKGEYLDGKIRHVDNNADTCLDTCIPLDRKRENWNIQFFNDTHSAERKEDILVENSTSENVEHTLTPGSNSQTPSHYLNAFKDKSHQRSGRRPSAVWEYFLPLRTEQNKVHAQCKFCSFRCAGVASRMVNHVMYKCNHAPQGIQLAGQRERYQKRKQSVPDLLDGKKSKHEPAIGDYKEPFLTSSFLTENSSVKEGANGNSLSDFSSRWNLFVQKFLMACAVCDVPKSFIQEDSLLEALKIFVTIPTAVGAESPSQITFLGTETGTMMLLKHSDDEFQSFCRNTRYLTVLLLHTVTGGIVYLLYSDKREIELWSSSSLQAHRLSKNNALDICDFELDARAAQKAHLELRGQFSPGTFISICSPISCSCLTSQIIHDDTYALAGSCLTRQSICMLGELLLCTKILASLREASCIMTSIRVLLCTSSEFRSRMAIAGPQLQFFCIDGCTSKQNSARNWDYVLNMVIVLKDLMTYLCEAIRKEKSYAEIEGDDELLQHYRNLKHYIFEDKSVWKRLECLSDLFTPFVWLFASSQTRNISSSQIIGCWLWILTSIESLQVKSTSSSENDHLLLNATEVATFKSSWLRIVHDHVKAHHLVALLLDPRFHGAGFSPTGKRKVKSMVVQLHESLNTGSEQTLEMSMQQANDRENYEKNRRDLLDQLSCYINKKGVFEDVVAWEMTMSNASPEWFWTDFEQDAAILSRLAKAVLLYYPQVSSASGYFLADSGNPRDMVTMLAVSDSQGDDFRWQQYTHRILQKKGKALDISRVSQQYANFLFRPWVTSQDQSANCLPHERWGQYEVNVLDTWIARIMQIKSETCCKSSSMCRPETATAACEAEIYSNIFLSSSENDLSQLIRCVTSFFVPPSRTFSQPPTASMASAASNGSRSDSSMHGSLAGAAKGQPTIII